MPEETTDAIDVRPGRHLVDTEVLGEEQVAEGVDGVRPRVVDQFAHRPAFPAEALRPLEIPDPDLAQAAGAAEQDAALLEILPDPGPCLLVGQQFLRLRRAAGLD